MNTTNGNRDYAIINPIVIGIIADETAKLFESEERLSSFISGYELLQVKKGETAKDALHRGLRLLNRFAGFPVERADNTSRRELFQFIEDLCLPVLHNNNRAETQTFIDKLNNNLKENFIIVEGRLYEVLTEKENTNSEHRYLDKDGKEQKVEVPRQINPSSENAIETPKVLEFDDVGSTLYFAGKKIKISKRAESDHHALLRTIFKDKTKVWNADEILEDWNFDTERNTPKQKVYQAAMAVNRIVAQDTAIKDFLDITTKTVCINRMYLN